MEIDDSKILKLGNDLDIMFSHLQQKIKDARLNESIIFSGHNVSNDEYIIAALKEVKAIQKRITSVFDDHVPKKTTQKK